VEIIPQLAEEPPAKSRDAAAAIVGTNRQYVSDAKRIEATAPELIPEILAGNMSIPEAKREIKKQELVCPADEDAPPLTPTDPAPHRVFCSTN
jgi:hypothetical protein